MQFLIAIGRQALVSRLSLGDFTPHDFGSRNSKPFSHQSKNIHVICSDQPLLLGPGRDDLLLWDGSVIQDTTAFSGLMPTKAGPTILGDYVSALEKERKIDDVSGVFGCACVSSEGRCVIATDPLSQYAIFHYSKYELHLFSNSLRLIEKAGALLDHPITRDFTSGAYEAAFGAGGWTRTGLGGVHKIPPNHFGIYDREELRFFRFASIDFSRSPNPEAYREEIASAGRSLRSSSLALSNMLPERGLVLDLSGGMDTRLLLGSQLASDRKNFHVFLGGAPYGPDQMVASQLVDHYDLDSVYFLSNLSAEEDYSAIATARRAAYRFMGTSNLYQADLGSL